MVEAVGLVQARVGSGRYVTASRPLDPSGGLSVWMQLQPVSDVIAVRRILEPAAIMAIPATQLATLAAETRQLLDRMRTAHSRGKAELATRLHTQFHLTLVRYAPTRLHGALLASMSKAAEGAQLEIFRTPRAGSQSIARHVPMVEAIEAGDVAQAAAHLVDHLTPVFVYLLDQEEP